MAYTTINKSTDYFNTVLYTGNGSTQSITGVGFQPDWVWCKTRNDTQDHQIIDAVRGVTKTLASNGTAPEFTDSNGLTAFGTDGFTLGSSGGINGSSDTLVSWNWLAGNGTASNSNGSITSTVSANTTAGFSIVSYTGTGANATIGHGLGVTPKMFIIKDRTSGTANDWFIYNKNIGATNYVRLNDTGGAASSSTLYQDTDPTSSVFYIGTNGNVNTNGNNYIAYCFVEKTGYSNFGLYKGNGNADGTFVYTGFKPAFLITKKTNNTGPWDMFDNTRNVINPVNSRLHPSASDTEYTNAAMNIDFVSNGFKIRTTDNELNTSSANYIYMAFAEAPLVGTNDIPCTAR